MTELITTTENTADVEPAAGTWFYKALRCHVQDPEEARCLADTHRRHAATIRGGIPDVIEDLRSWSVARGREQRAANHDEIAAVCERHAARLQAARDARRQVATTVADAGVTRPEA